MRLILAFLSGALFGTGLYIAGMTDRFAEREFERLRGAPPEFEFSS